MRKSLLEIDWTNGVVAGGVFPGPLLLGKCEAWKFPENDPWEAAFPSCDARIHAPAAALPWSTRDRSGGVKRRTSEGTEFICSARKWENRDQHTQWCHVTILYGGV